MSLDSSIRELLKFLEDHQDDEISYRNGMLVTQGCNGGVGGCCSKQYDLDELSEELRDLIK